MQELERDIAFRTLYATLREAKSGLQPESNDRDNKPTHGTRTYIEQKDDLGEFAAPEESRR